MKKAFLLTMVFCAIVLLSFSQSDKSLVKASAKGLYIEHKVTAKENFYSLGRSYNVHPKQLAAFNGLDMAKGLSLGQSVNIPLSDSNFNRAAAEGTPLYYKSSLKQTVGSISAISKTPAENIRKWNSLGNDIAPGAAVIIGYLITTGEEPSVAAVANIVDTVAPKSLAEEKKETVVVPKKEDTKPVKEEPKAVVKEDISKNTTIPSITIDGNGYFKAFFIQQVKAYPLSKDETITSGVFKTISGWNDGKYYALIDGVEPGTIIKVINPANSNAIYAKVLGKMSGIRQNEGLNLRISNSAASVLNITEMDKFIVKVNY